MVKIDKFTGAVTNETFDTSKKSDRESFDELLKNMNRGDLLSISVTGKATVKNLSKYAREKLVDMGSRQIKKLDVG